MLFLAMFWHRRFLILSLWRFRKDSAQSSAVKFSLNIYMFVPSLSNSLLTVIRKSLLLNGNPHSETVYKCSTISHSASFERTVGWPGSLLIISPFFSLMKFWKRERAIEYFNLAQATPHPNVKLWNIYWQFPNGDSHLTTLTCEWQSKDYWTKKEQTYIYSRKTWQWKTGYCLFWSAIKGWGTFQPPTFRPPVLHSKFYCISGGWNVQFWYQKWTFQPPTIQPRTFQPPTFQPATFQPPTFQFPTIQSPTFQPPIKAALPRLFCNGWNLIYYSHVR